MHGRKKVWKFCKEDDSNQEKGNGKGEKEIIDTVGCYSKFMELYV